jgi:hypothetical protein
VSSRHLVSTSAPVQHLSTCSAPQHLLGTSAPTQHLSTYSAPQHLLSTYSVPISIFGCWVPVLTPLSSFWEFNISRREHCFELKFSGHSSHKYSYLWAKFQLEIMSFDLLVHNQLQAKILLKWLELWRGGLSARILLGVFIPHSDLPIDKR